MSADNDSPVQLRRILSRRDVISISFGAMVGWSWVVLAGEMIVRAGTLGSIAAFATGAVMVWLVGLTYAELTSALSRAGGEISFTFVGLGPRAAYVCGWTLVLAYVSVCAFEAVALPTVFQYLFPGFEVGYLYTVEGWDVHASWVAVGVVGALLVGFVNYLGIKLAATVQGLSAVILLLIGVSLFVPGIAQGDVAQLQPLFTGLEGFFGVVIMTPFLFLGFDIIPQVAEDINMPRRAVSRLILFSILLALGWYVLVQWTLGVTLDHGSLAGPLPTADAMSVVYGSPWGGRVLVFGGLLGIVTSWNAFFIGASRLMFAMSRGGMLPSLFARLHARYQSPVAVVALLTVVTAAAPFFGRPALVALVNAGGLAAVLAYLLVAISFLVIRRRHPDLARPYKVPRPMLIGVLAVAATLFFVLLYLPGSPSALGSYEWAIVLIWVVLGMFFAAGIRGRVAAMGEQRRTRLVLGDYADSLYPEARSSSTS